MCLSSDTMTRKLWRSVGILLVSIIVAGVYFVTVKRQPELLPLPTLSVTVQPRENRKQTTHRYYNVTSRSVISRIPDRILMMIEQIESQHEAIDGAPGVVNLEKPKCKPGGNPVNGVEDLLCMKPPRFLPNLKNPCWFSSTKQFQCLPYFQVIGMDKSGSTDLFDRIAMHPDVIHNKGTLGKETMWWSWRRYGHWLKRDLKKKETFQQYINYFSVAAKTIATQNTSASVITGDGTPMDLWDMSGWVSIAQNHPPDPPTFLTPHLIKHVNPNVKLLVILRDPVERLFSDYFFLGLGKMSPKAFHSNLLTSIELLSNCTRTLSLRMCLFKREFHIQVPARIHLGFYSIFLREWFKVFRREQFHILRTEDYSKNMRKHIEGVFQFLGLRKLPEPEMTRIGKSTRKHVTKRKKKATMLPESRAILKRLYENFNLELATILNDRKYTWDKNT